MIERTRIKPELAATVGQWEYVCCHCLVDFGSASLIVQITHECEACGNTNLRFFHTLENLEDKKLIEVGIECARALLGPEEWKIPGLAENEVKRKEGWRIHYNKPGWCYATRLAA
jgi:hypothetical protein